MQQNQVLPKLQTEIELYSWSLYQKYVTQFKYINVQYDFAI